MKVYGIHEGSIYEGGSMQSVLFESLDDARKEVKKLIHEGNKFLKDANTRGFNFKLYRKSKNKDYWEANTDCIYIQELSLSLNSENEKQTSEKTHSLNIPWNG